MSKKCPTAIDLFAGCGGVTEGLRQAGFNVVGALELEALPAKTYRLNHTKVSFKEKDIRQVNGREWLREIGMKPGDLDLLVGCPPCQGFSTLRTRNGDRWNRDSRNGLVEEMLRLVNEMCPKAVMMENVPGLREKKVFKEFAGSLRKLGYLVKSDTVNAQYFGVPQRRRRLVLVAGRGFEIPFPREARVGRTVRNAIEHLSPSMSRLVTLSLSRNKVSALRWRGSSLRSRGEWSCAPEPAASCAMNRGELVMGNPGADGARQPLRH